MRTGIARKGFRPFFLLAALFACAIVPAWILIVFGVLPPGAYLDAASWHAHEMIFGYATAVIAGFLLTAVGNWTQRETATGAPLIALAALWAAGRVAMVVAAALPPGAAAIVDLAFLPALFVVLARPILATKNRRNVVVLLVVAALFATNLVVHLDALGVLPLGSARRACLVAVDVVVLLILVISARVIPLFTRNATGVASIASNRPLDAATAGSMALLIVADVVVPETKVASALAGVVGILAVARAARWGALHGRREPLLWILHVGYGWVPVGLLLRALPALGVAVWSSLATHALTVGAIGGLTLGMMARVALGHTGRPLAASRPIAWSFALITAAAIARSIVPLVVLRWHFVALVIAAVLWTTAFALYLIVYTPILTAPRADGKPG